MPEHRLDSINLAGAFEIGVTTTTATIIMIMMMMIMMMMMMMIVIIKKTNNYSNRIERRNSRTLTISSLRRELSPTRRLFWPGRNRVQITCTIKSAYHVSMSCATWYEGTAQPLSLIEFKLHLFELYFTGLNQ